MINLVRTAHARFASLEASVFMVYKLRWVQINVVVMGS